MWMTSEDASASGQWSTFYPAEHFTAANIEAECAMSFIIAALVLAK